MLRPTLAIGTADRSSKAAGPPGWLHQWAGLTDLGLGSSNEVAQALGLVGEPNRPRFSPASRVSPGRSGWPETTGSFLCLDPPRNLLWWWADRQLTTPGSVGNVLSAHVLVVAARRSRGRRENSSASQPFCGAPDVDNLAGVQRLI